MKILGMVLIFVRCVRGGAEFVNVPDSGINYPDQPPANNQPSNGGQPPETIGPPPEAIDACIGLMVGDCCGFQSPDGLIEGTCMEIQGQLTCVPESGPPAGNQPSAPPIKRNNRNNRGWLHITIRDFP